MDRGDRGRGNINHGFAERKTMRSEHVVRHRLTVDDYYRMAEVGILKPDARVELIEGEIIDMAPMGSRHADVVSELSSRLVAAVGRNARVRCQLPVGLDEYSEPEPDVVVVKPRRYTSRHPTPDDVLLLIEVSDSSLAFDRSVKLPLYARHGIPEVWIVDLSTDHIYAHRDPHDGSYKHATLLEVSSSVAIPMLPESILDLTGLF